MPGEQKTVFGPQNLYTGAAVALLLMVAVWLTTLYIKINDVLDNAWLLEDQRQWSITFARRNPGVRVPFPPDIKSRAPEVRNVSVE